MAELGIKGKIALITGSARGLTGQNISRVRF